MPNLYLLYDIRDICGDWIKITIIYKYNNCNFFEEQYYVHLGGT